MPKRTTQDRKKGENYSEQSIGAQRDSAQGDNFTIVVRPSSVHECARGVHRLDNL